MTLNCTHVYPDSFCRSIKKSIEDELKKKGYSGDDLSIAMNCNIEDLAKVIDIQKCIEYKL